MTATQNRITKVIDVINSINISPNIDESSISQEITIYKCKYFEVVVNDSELLNLIHQETSIEIQHGNMLIGRIKELEKILQAFNNHDIRMVIINDWNA